MVFDIRCGYPTPLSSVADCDMAHDIRLQINDDQCRFCHRCLAAKVCTVRAIVQLDPDDAPYLDVRRCYDCRLCLPACPFGAVVMG